PASLVDCQKLPLPAQALNERLSAPGIGREEQAALTISALTGLSAAEAAEVAAKDRMKQEAEQAAKENLRLEHERKMAGMREWTEEELRMMDKALNKFPQGTPRRWDAVTSYIRTRTLDEVLLMVKDKQGMSATRARAQEDFRSGMKKKAELTCTADLRINAFTDVNVNLAGDAATTLMAAPGFQGAEEDAAPATPTPAPDCNGSSSSSSTASAAAPPTHQEAGDASADDAAPASPSSLPGHTAAGTASSNGLVARPGKQAEAVDSLPGSAAPAGATTPSPPSPPSQQPAAQPQPAVAATTTKPAAADKQSGKKTAASGKAAAGKAAAAAAAGKAAAAAAAAPVPAAPTDSTTAAKAALTDKSGPKAAADAVQASPVKAASPPAAAANGPSKAEGAGKAKPSVVVSADSGAWSEAQELALVQAMKQFGKELGTERWEKVAELVPGKSKAQCFKRFKELRDAFRAKKAPAAPPALQSSGGGGGLMSGLMGSMVTGAAMGTGSAIAHRAVDSFMGPRETHVVHEHAPAAPSPAAAPQMPSADGPCSERVKQFGDCMSRTGGDMGSCQIYFDAMQQCRAAFA
ncbi:hypothetical protein QJQ45_020759, partial [Haematococcus lacustris]